MADVKWIKLVVNVFNNRKIEQIEVMPDGDGIVVIWFKLLCLAGSINDDGMVYFTKEVPYTEEMLSTHFHRPLALVKLALRVFVTYGMVEIVNDVIHISNWEKYQSVDRLGEIREYNRIAQQNHRQKKKILAITTNVNDKSMTSQRGHDTDIDIDIDTKSKNKSNGADKPPSARKFVPPSVDEVKAYCLERKNDVDAERWIAHYTSNGWMVGKNKMRDWKAAVRTWEGNDYGPKRNIQGNAGAGNGTGPGRADDSGDGDDYSQLQVIRC